MANPVSNEQAHELVETLAELLEAQSEHAEIAQRMRALSVHLTTLVQCPTRRRAFMHWANEHVLMGSLDERLAAQGIRNLLIHAYNRDRMAGR